LGAHYQSKLDQDPTATKDEIEKLTESIKNLTQRLEANDRTSIINHANNKEEK